MGTDGAVPHARQFHRGRTRVSPVHYLPRPELDRRTSTRRHWPWVVYCVSVLSRNLAKKLRTGRTLRQPRRPKNKRATRYIDPGRLIEDRPDEVADRAVAGHWKGDLIAGAYNATAIATGSSTPAGTSSWCTCPTDHIFEDAATIEVPRSRFVPVRRLMISSGCAERFVVDGEWSFGARVTVHGAVTLPERGGARASGQHTATRGSLTGAHRAK